MVVDSSALVSIINHEQERQAFINVLVGAPTSFLSVASYVETSVVVEKRLGPEGAAHLDLLVEVMGLSLQPVSIQQAEIARLAYRAFGKGNHKAALNFGDCFAYALAKALNQPLLFKGGDFALTDIEAVAY